MNIEELTEYCQSLKFVTTEILWGDVLVFKVGGKMFCFAPMDEGELKMNLKCDPEEAIVTTECPFAGTISCCASWVSYEQKILEYRTNRWFGKR